MGFSHASWERCVQVIACIIEVTALLVKGRRSTDLPSLGPSLSFFNRANARMARCGAGGVCPRASKRGPRRSRGETPLDGVAKAPGLVPKYMVTVGTRWYLLGLTAAPPYQRVPIGTSTIRIRIPLGAPKPQFRGCVWPHLGPCAQRTAGCTGVDPLREVTFCVHNML